MFDDFDDNEAYCRNCMWNISSEMAETIQKENNYSDEEVEEMEGCTLNIDHHGKYHCENWIHE